ncbi:ankyrin repeat protein [Phlyctema vagabunda]|uniref:Ankyrin repeat protein n=1 Tax=Phlyctema vagabunda TaxID=108571 RepID=A0ABR4PHA9_9HELO
MLLGILIAPGNIDNVKLLLPSHTTNTRECGSYGNPLYAAIIGHHKEIVSLLLSSGWDSNFKGGELGRLILAAAAEARLDCMALLLEKEVDLKVRDPWDRTALIISAGTLPTKAVKLLAAGSDINAADEYGVTPLISASMARACETVEVLLEFS